MVSPPTRYLVFFQYFGTKYSGVMETLNDQSILGVQNYLQKAAQNLKPIVPIKFYISSRTDTGVHALCNSAHLDIQRAPGKPAFNEKQLIYSLNYHLRPEPIRILNAYRVANSFHARFSALSRTYVYRLLMGCTHHSEIPVFERDLCWAPVGGHLNVPAMQDAAQFLLGTHDFSTFRSLNSETPFQSPIRTILQGAGVLGAEVQEQIISLPTGPKNGWGSSCSWPGKTSASSYKGVTGDKRFTSFSTECHGSTIWTLSKISGI
ncbi:tRNA pseudouridine synthase-like 1 isoform X2 [Larus michahellis]|uniref:tRNA pseudouridine synthase-like 1 isoform X2 n=1 Tax=Larus michahellis TaxID=119627 RepID=UPI003D9B09CC